MMWSFGRKEGAHSVCFQRAGGSVHNRQGLDRLTQVLLVLERVRKVDDKRRIAEQGEGISFLHHVLFFLLFDNVGLGQNFHCGKKGTRVVWHQGEGGIGVQARGTGMVVRQGRVYSQAACSLAVPLTNVPRQRP